MAENTRLLQRRKSREELPHVRGQGWRLRGNTQCLRSGAAMRGVTPCPRSGASAGRSNPMPLSPRPGVAAGRSNPTPEARGSGREDQPHVQGCAGAGGPRGCVWAKIYSPVAILQRPLLRATPSPFLKSRAEDAPPRPPGLDLPSENQCSCMAPSALFCGHLTQLLLPALPHF